jgi:hypothetical protein
MDEYERTGVSCFPPKICSCGCGQPITPQNDEPDGPQYMRIDGKTIRVSADCYFEKFGDFIDENPIVTPRRSRGA